MAKPILERGSIDELYHKLRLLFLSNNIQEREAVEGIVKHLCSPAGDYTGLLRFLTYYGESFLLGDVCAWIRESRLEFTRVVELGAGFGWLGRGVALAFGNKGTPLQSLFIDKRQWPLIDIVADIESKNGSKRVLDELKSGDLIVMSELLHCLNRPAEVMRPFSKWPIVAIEYAATDVSYVGSYDAQIRKLGCTPIPSSRSVFPNQKIQSYQSGEHEVIIAQPLP